MRAKRKPDDELHRGPPKRARTPAGAAAIPSLVFAFLGLDFWKRLLDEDTAQTESWIDPHFAAWGKCAPVDWSVVSRNAQPWMAPMFRENPNVDWMQFAVLLGEDCAWKLPLLRAASATEKLSRQVWHRLSLMAKEWMLPLLEENASKLDFERFARFGEKGPAIPDPKFANNTYWHPPPEPDIPKWKVELVKWRLHEFDWRDVCRHSNQRLADVFQANFDRIVFSEFFATRAMWKVAFLEKNADRFDWAGADTKTWELLSRDAQQWMPLQEHFDSIDVKAFLNSGLGAKGFWRWHFVKKNTHRIAWDESCEMEIVNFHKGLCSAISKIPNDPLQ